MTDQPRQAAEYALGYSEREKGRLIIQSRFYGELTERLFRMAGIRPGNERPRCRMRRRRREPPRRDDRRTPEACWASIAQSTRSIRRGRVPSGGAGEHRIRCRGTCRISTQAGRLDALVGRLVLMYFPDPAATLAHLLKFVRPGGLVVFQEMEMSLARTRPPVRLYQTCLDVILETFRRAGFEIDMGSRLYSTFLQAGLPRPELHMEGRVEGGAGSAAYELTAETVRSLLPMMERLGVATSSEFEVDTLAARMEAETCAEVAWSCRRP